jgi:hypothetical protein|tara:strand:- start:220 stop:825 length:606 start_codon:yes stop_codon:yes gene_type:complete
VQQKILLKEKFKMADKIPVNISPIGVAAYPHLNKPDTRFDDDGIYQVNLIYSKKEVKEIQDIVEPLMNGGFHNPVKPELGEDDKPTGKFNVRFKMKALMKIKGKRVAQRPVLTDTAGNRVISNIGGGSKLRIAYQAVPFDQGKGGVTLRMKAVRVIELVEYIPGVQWGVEDEGFEEEKSDGSTGDEFEIILDTNNNNDEDF